MFTDTEIKYSFYVITGRITAQPGIAYQQFCRFPVFRDSPFHIDIIIPVIMNSIVD